jgi:hypothetical protein
MTDEHEPSPVVQVTTSRAAYAEPHFIIEHAGRYYVTVAVLEYDPHAANLTAEQREGVAAIEKLYRSGEQGRVGVVELARLGGPHPMNTGPMNTQAR